MIAVVKPKGRGDFVADDFEFLGGWVRVTGRWRGRKWDLDEDVDQASFRWTFSERRTYIWPRSAVESIEEVS